MKLLLSFIAACVLFVSPSKATPEKTHPTTSVAPTTTSTTLVSTSLVEKWSKVAWCETHGNWAMQGATFSGGLGMSNVVWKEYGGLAFALNAGLATKEEQVVIATRINKGYIPDQDGCNGGW